jgi:DNA-binding NarL/FixJ family response regulator
MRVIVLDDSIIVREGLRRLLETEGHHVAAALARPDQIDAAVAAKQPEVVILDIRMPPTFTDEGIAVAVSLRKRNPELGILVLSQYAVPEYATRLLENGPRRTGYLLKDRILQPFQLSQALQRLGDGGTVVDPDVVGELLLSRHNGDPLHDLTAQERQVLQLMAEGLSNKGIAGRLYVSLNTVGTHVQHIFRKLGLPDSGADNRRVLAVLAFLKDRYQG